MHTPETPENEKERTRAIEKLGIIYSPSEARFDRITRLVGRHFDVQTVLVSFVYKETQWFKSRQGLKVFSTQRSLSLCAHAILQPTALVVENALLDIRFKDHPLVLNGPRIRFYAGYPVKNSEGVILGTLCLIDSVPRTFSQDDLNDLRDFAKLVETEINRPRKANVLSHFIQELSEHQRLLLIDPVVGSWNRRGFESLLGKEFEHARTKGHRLGLISVKLSSLDLVLERYGHDRVVDFTKFTAALIRDCLPSDSSVGSLGADAFLAVCPDVNERDFNELIVEIKRRFESTTLATQGIKALVDVEISALTFSGAELNKTGIEAVDSILMIS
jgi:diguanylate cyclase (GGDEF)-like protein